MSAPDVERKDSDIRVACGIAWWKRKRIAQFLNADGATRLLFTDDAQEAVAAAGDGKIAVWPSRMPEGLEALAGDRLVRIEDGFIRSIGLGADLHPPLSIVVDRSGVYYDPSQPSDLETILENENFTPELLARAEALADMIVLRGISKYESQAPSSAPVTRGKRTILVAGQVEDDLSVRCGGGGVAGNLDLLRRARGAEPDAHILFKPHPDVDAGHRKGHVSDAELCNLANEIVRGESMPSLLARVDGVHVLTSLTGFEALLRGLDVTVHGQPFYAGWGLTADATPHARRTRRLVLDELVAATLLLHPTYVSRTTGRFTSPERALDELLQWRTERSPSTSEWRRAWRLWARWRNR